MICVTVKICYVDRVGIENHIQMKRFFMKACEGKRAVNVYYVRKRTSKIIK